MAEDIDSNVFFNTLKTTFQEVYNDAAENQRTICVPHSRSFEPEMIDRWFIESHLLTPSPYFAGQYVTPNGKCCEIEDGESTLVTGSGFSEEGRTCKILSENVFYNRDYKAYRVLITDSTLEGPQRRVQLNDQSDMYADIVPAEERTFQRLLQFLVSFPGVETALEKIDVSVRSFNRSYEIVEGWEDQVGKHCNEMCNRAKDLVFGVSSVSHYASICRLHVELIEEAVESYVMGGVHDKVFQDILELNAAEDRKLACILAASNIRPEDIGVRTDLCSLCLDDAVTQVKGLVQAGVITPREKLCAIQRTTTTLTAIAEAELAEQGKTCSDHALTTDDLLPLLCMTLIKAAPPNLVTHSVYLSNFNSSSTSTTELGFHLANFQAAVQFLRESSLTQNDGELEPPSRGSGLGFGPESDPFRSSWMIEEPSHLAHASPVTEPAAHPATPPQEMRLSRAAPERLVQRRTDQSTTGLGDFLDALIDEGSHSISSRQFYSQNEQTSSGNKIF